MHANTAKEKETRQEGIEKERGEYESERFIEKRRVASEEVLSLTEIPLYITLGILLPSERVLH